MSKFLYLACSSTKRTMIKMANKPAKYEISRLFKLSISALEKDKTAKYPINATAMPTKVFKGSN